MAMILKRLFRGYSWLFNEVADPRVKDFPLMQSPFEPFVIGMVYLYSIFYLIPRFMENRPPYKLDRIITIFNITQVLVNGWIVYHGFFELLTINWFCAPVDYSDTPHNRFAMNVIYIYFLTKIADLLDTVFFVLRKKNSQVSFLHVYHHFGMICLSWIGVKFLAGGHSYYLGAVNAFVHTVMYFYYLLTVWNPELKKKIWWKKYITQLQLYQFIFFLVTYGQLLFKPTCGYPKIASYFILPQNIFMICLFGEFYYKSYIKPNRNKDKKES